MSLAAAGCGSDPNPDEDDTCPAAAVRNAGHRGTGVNGSANAFPENTLPSLQQAFAEGADMCELDVQHSADGALVVIHDDTVDRTTDGSGCVGDLTLAELQALDAAVGTSLEGTGVRIPTLAEVMAAVDGGLNVEIKLREMAGCPSSNPAQLAADVVAAIEGDASPRAIHVSSFDAEVLSAVETMNPAIDTGLVTANVDHRAEAAARGLDALNISELVASADDIARIRDAGLAANVWTVNREAKMRELLGLGVGMIITDEPDQLRAIQQELCPTP